MRERTVGVRVCWYSCSRVTYIVSTQALAGEQRKRGERGREERERQGELFVRK